MMSTPPFTQPCKVALYELKRINAGFCVATHSRMCSWFGYGVALALRLINKCSLALMREKR